MEKVWAAAVGSYKDGVPDRPCKFVAQTPGKGKQGLKEVPWAGEQEQGRQPVYQADLPGHSGHLGTGVFSLAFV